LHEFRDLLRAFAARDITLRYRQTALGPIWVLLQPLLAAAIFSFVFGRVAKLPSGAVPYVVFSFAGLLAWNAFNAILTKASASLTQYSAMVSKVYFPRLLLPLSVVGSSLLDFAVSLIVMVILDLGYGINPGLKALLLPVWLAIVVALALGLGLVACTLMVRYRDVQYVLPIAAQMLLYASPVAYGLNAVPGSARTLVELNPLTGVLEAFRWSLVGTTHPPAAALCWSAGAALAALVLGIFVFASFERDFADVI